MRTKSLLVLLASLLFANVALAKICKTVGPDGAVTYTDRPGADACDEQAAATSPSSADKNAGAARAGAQARPPVVSASPAPGAKQAPAEAPAAAAAPAATVETAVIGILGIEDLVQRSYEFCLGVLPSSAARYGNAADGWRDRNATATTKMRRALMQTFNGPQQKTMIEGVKGRNQRQLDPVISAAKASQIKWCDQTAGEIDARALDIKSTLLAPLSSF